MISPLGVVMKKNSKFHPIVDMQFLNSFLAIPKFKFNGLKELAMMIQPGDWMATIDFHDGFQHIEVDPNHHHLLSFKWRGQRYAFKVLPFGLNASLWAFMRFVKATVRHLHQMGVRVLAYMDDLIIMGSSKEDATAQVTTTLNMLQQLGWQINEEKSALTLSQTLEFLSFIVDSMGEPRFRMPAEKIRAVRQDVDRLLLSFNQTGSVPIRCLAAVAGLCVSLTKAVLPAPLMLCNIYRTITTRLNWADSIPLLAAAVCDLLEWRDGIRHWNGNVALQRQPNLIVETNASLLGWGATTSCGTLMLAGWWPTKRRHINELELRAVWKVCLAFNHHLHGKTVLFHSDNVTMVAYLNKMGGCSQRLNHALRKIVDWVDTNDVAYLAVHLAGTANGQADHLSHLFPQHEWRMSCALFQQIDDRWGPHLVDRFATAQNALLPRFNSRFTERGSEVVDALLQLWTGENNWATPPIALIPCVVRLVVQQGATTTILALVWKGCCWWNDLIDAATEPPIPEMALDGLPDLWASRTKGWSANALASLNTALAATMWHRYWGYLRRFCDFCWMRDIAFPLPASLAIAATANFIEQATCTSKRPASTIGGISAAIVALYELLDLHPMHDPLIA